MVLSDWLEGLDYELLQGSLEVQVSDVSYDSRKAKEGDVFVCMTEPAWTPTCLFPRWRRRGSGSL